MDNSRLVRAYYDTKGGWGVPPKRFNIIMTPTGKVLDINMSSFTNLRDIPFKIGDTVSFGELIKFENESDYELRIRGRFSESTLNEDISRYDMTKMTPRLWALIKTIIKITNTRFDSGDIVSRASNYSQIFVLNMTKYSSITAVGCC